MANYFSKYPKLIYNGKVITDIISRIAIREKYADRLALYYPYYLQDGDTPEIIASKYYNDPEKHWVVLLINGIVNPTFDFPLSSSTFDAYLNAKYNAQGALISRTGSEYAKLTLNISPPGYRAVISTTDVITGTITVQKINIDHTSYISGYNNPNMNYPDSTTQIGNIIYQQTKETYTIYDRELELNEQKRIIKILRKEYVSQVEEEFRLLMLKSYV